eukprot:SAG11_NODE_565_length_8503_cov_20.810209_8_plen_112_part_00
MVMGARPTRAGGKQIRPNRHRGWLRACPLGAVVGGATNSIELDLTTHFYVGRSYRHICTSSPTTNYLPNFLLAVLLRRNCDPRRSTAPIMYVTPDPGSTNTSVLVDLVLES